MILRALACVGLAALSILSEGPTAMAQTPSVSGTSSTLIEWRTNNRNGISGDDDFQDAIIRSQFAIDADNVRSSLRFDAEMFANRPTGVDRRNDARLERVGLELDFNSKAQRSTFYLGDFYAQFASGMALSLRRLDELGVDVALRGVRADLSAFDDRVTVVLLGGQTNAVNIEAQRLRYTVDPKDVLGGIRSELHLGYTTLGLHGVGLNVQAQNLQSTTANAGATLASSFGNSSFSAEFNAQHRDLAGTVRTGRATYLSATTRLARISLLAEFKDYRSFEPLRGRPPTQEEGSFVYSFSPTAERIDQEVIDNTSTTGGRLKADLTTSDETSSSVFASAGAFQSHFADQWFAHGFGGIDQRWESGRALLLSGGYRREWWKPSGDLARAIAHAEVDLMNPVAPGFDLHLITQHQSHVDALGATRSLFHRGNSSLELSVHQRWAFVAGFDWNTQNQVAGNRKAFGYGVVRYRASDRFFIQILAGNQRGGIRCIAGACRDFPAFSGVRIDTSLRF